MADERGALLQKPGQLGERQALGHTQSCRRKGSRQTLEAVAFGLTTNQQEFRGGGIDEVSQQIGPFFLGPVLLLAAAAGMQRDLVQRRELFGQGKARNGIGVENGKALKWLEKGLAGVKPFSFV